MQIPNVNAWIERFGASRVPPILWVVLLWFLVSVPAITLRGAHYEEGTTIALARGMFEDGHWLAPYRYGARFVERPVLVSWLLGAVGASTGDVGPVMARVPIVLSILGSALLLFWFVNRYATIYGALFAAACFLISPMMLQKLVTAEVDSVV
jgi:4-amino-4-deoxy-L-arabinose transferase-like glycosyltransferase